jgi:hypothetical protein
MNSEKPYLDFYSILCGVFLYEKKKDNTATVDWTERITSPQGFWENINRSYYKNYLNNIFKGASGNDYEIQAAFLEHNTVKKLVANPLLCQIPTRDLNISIPYFDCFLFSGGVGIFCFKVNFTDPREATYEKISHLLVHLRNLFASIKIDGKQCSVSEFIQSCLAEGHKISGNWNSHLNQLKLYTIIDDPSVKALSENEEASLFELSHMMPIGTIKNRLKDMPSKEYYSEVLDNNSIRVYDNWRAISLLDSFTRISCGYPDIYKSWELEFLHVYIHCLYCKFQLYLFNSQLTNLLEFNRHTHTIRNRFIEFVNDYSLPYIAYRFLPNLLYEKMTNALEIQKELDAMERKVGRLNEGYQNKKSQQLNRLLLIISVLSVASVLNDISEWLTNMGTPSHWVYNPISLGTALAGGATAFWLLFRGNSTSR